MEGCRGWGEGGVHEIESSRLVPMRAKYLPHTQRERQADKRGEISVRSTPLSIYISLTTLLLWLPPLICPPSVSTSNAIDASLCLPVVCVSVHEGALDTVVIGPRHFRVHTVTATVTIARPISTQAQTQRQRERGVS